MEEARATIPATTRPGQQGHALALMPGVCQRQERRPRPPESTTSSSRSRSLRSRFLDATSTHTSPSSGSSQAGRRGAVAAAAEAPRSPRRSSKAKGRSPPPSPSLAPPSRSPAARTKSAMLSSPGSSPSVPSPATAWGPAPNSICSRSLACRGMVCSASDKSGMPALVPSRLPARSSRAPRTLLFSS